MREFTTPMMQQYVRIKAQYQDCLVFFRLGDFYELFLDDAILGAKILGITLTQRPSGKDGHIPMAGVPFHAADMYIAKLVKEGHKVAICEQVSLPDSKGLVDREVIRVVTPGTVLDEKTLQRNEHNYLLSISRDKEKIGLAFVDVSTGDFQITEVAYGDKLSQVLLNEITRFRPVECIVSTDLYGDHTLLKLLSLQPGLNVYPVLNWTTQLSAAEDVLHRHFRVQTLHSFGLAGTNQAVLAAANLLQYIQDTQKNQAGHIRTLHWYQSVDQLNLDYSTITNLELFSTIRERAYEGSLLDCIDDTKTAMGARLLRTWLGQPLKQRHRIKERLDAVEELLENRTERLHIREQLQQLYDLERIIARLTLKIGTPLDVLNLKNSLVAVLAVKKLLQSSESALLLGLAEQLDPNLERLIQLINDQLVAEPPANTKHGHIIQPGVDAELDELRNSIYDGKSWLVNFEQIQRKATGISSLKVKFNQVFGYYIEISKPNLHLVPDHYERKQSMVNAERFSVPELKEYEEKIVTAEEKSIAREQWLFDQLVQQVLDVTGILQQAAVSVATLDCLVSFAQVAEGDRFVKPTLTESGELSITAGRHPMVEKTLGPGQFVPNDVQLNNADQQLIILTGPNMAGKSVYMRQVALIVIMAQVGMFVPAQAATISVVDQIFVRSGAADAIGSGLSTFMVEMVETAYILHQATNKSLVILDEIGRGTSTYDGISIAWAVAEYLVTNQKLAAKTLFATHYHELQALEDQYPEKVKNYQMMVVEQAGEPVFLHHIAPGRASHSYAVAVGKLAGLPEVVTKNATKILAKLEKRSPVPQSIALVENVVVKPEVEIHGEH